MSETEAVGGKKLTLFDATMLVMGGIIGVGIFFAPHGVAARVPDAGVFLALWMVGAVVAVCGAFTFAEWAATMPRAGGWFVFLREVFGPFVAFLFAWVVLGVISTGAIAVIASFGAETLVAEAGQTSHLLVAAAFIVGLTVITLCGIKIGAFVQNICMILKLIAIAALVAGGVAFFLAGRESAAVTVTVESRLGAGGLPAALLSVFFAFGGWQHICYVAPQVRDPVRTLPRAIVLGVLGVGAVYLAVNAAYVLVLGIDGLLLEEKVASAAAIASLGSRFERALGVAMAVSAFGVCAVNIIVTPGIYVAMARERLFFRSFGRLHSRTGAPVLALLLQCGIALAYLAWVSISASAPAAEGFRMDVSLLTESVVYAEWIFHGLVAWGLLRLRRRRADLPRPFRMPFWPWPAVLYFLVAAFIIVGNVVTGLAEKPFQVYVGLGVVALGAVVYPPWRAFFGRDRGAPPHDRKIWP